MEVDIQDVVEKIKNSSLIKRELKNTIPEKLKQLNDNKFFNSEEKISDLSVVKYNLEEFEKFKQNIKPILIHICNEFLKN